MQGSSSSGYGDGGSTATAPRDAVHFEKERGVTDVTVQSAVAHVTVRIAPDRLAAERLELLQALAADNVPLFLVKLLPEGISFAVRAENVAPCEALLTRNRIEYTLRNDLAVVYILAGAMRDLSGVMASIYEGLIEAGIRVHQTGDAYNAVLCLVSGAHAELAAEALKRRFIQRNAAEAAAAKATEAEQAAQASGSGLKAL